MPTINVSFEFKQGEHGALQATIKATRLASVLMELDRRFRNAVKHEDKEHMQEARDILNDSLELYDVDLLELMG